MREKPYDLMAAGILTGAMWAALLTAGPLRIALGLILILLLPGYILTAALFPSRDDLDWIERLALGVGLSIALVALLGLLLNFTPWGIRLEPVMALLTLFIGGVGALAYVRRMRLPVEKRMGFTLEVTKPAWSEYSTLDKALTLGLVASLVLAAGVLVFVITVPRPAERFTEFYILGPDGQAAGYPTNLTAGASGRIIVGIVNHEGRAINYTVVVTLEAYNVTTNATGAPVRTLVGSSPVAQFPVALPDGGKQERNLTFTVPGPGLFRLELQLLLPGGTAPYRELHLWVNVRA